MVGVDRICVCAHCAKEFAGPLRGPLSRFCSLRCKRSVVAGYEIGGPWTCKHCGASFTGHKRKFCSRECRNQYFSDLQKRRLAEHSPAALRYSLLCHQCNQPFRSVSKHRKFCCNDCKWKSFRRQDNKRYLASKRRLQRRKEVESQGEVFTREEIFERDGWRCQICRKRILRSHKFPHPRSATLDHIVPITLGGKHTRKNVQCLCHRCNSRKTFALSCAQLRLFG